jgi:hypothetical protein
MSGSRVGNNLVSYASPHTTRLYDPCKEDFTVRTGTVFERSHNPLHKWIYAMCLLVTSRKGISSMQLAGEYVCDDVTTNGMESVWAVLKRGLHGVYHHASDKHLHRNVDEFTFRLNEGNVKRHTLDRLDSLTDGVAGKRLSYKDLIG